MTDAPPPLPECLCPPENAFHDDTCPHYLELLRREREFLRRTGRMY